jgi:outer membrane lipoprotein-sorting protein
MSSERFPVSKNAWHLSGALIAAAVTLGSGPTLAQEAKPKSAPAVPGAWAPSTQPAQAATSAITLEPNQVEALKQVSAYFNGFENLKGTFTQTDADKKRLRGKFFVKRPGRLRFEYAPPSKQLIVSDGQQLAIQDLDLGTDDRIALEQTPFRLLLRKDVDLARDARISEVQIADDLIIVSLQDKSPDAPGLIRLFLTKAPKVELKEWVTTDAQGRDTRVELAGLVTTEDIDAAQFKVVNPQVTNPNQKN